MDSKKIFSNFGGGNSFSTGPTSTSSKPKVKEARPMVYGGGKTIAALRDGSKGSEDETVVTGTYGNKDTNKNLFSRTILNKVRGSGDATGTGSTSSSGSLGA